MKSFIEIAISEAKLALLKDEVPVGALIVSREGKILAKTGNKNKELNEELEIIDVNFVSLIPWIKSIVTKKRIEKKGSLWIFSSVAGDRGRPSNYQYGAAKSALTIYCEGLAQICSDKPFSVRILKAGLIKTQMSKNSGPSFLFTSKKKIGES